MMGSDDGDVVRIGASNWANLYYRPDGTRTRSDTYGKMAAITLPVGSCVGRSLSEWTAKAMLRSSSADSS